MNKSQSRIKLMMNRKQSEVLEDSTMIIIAHKL